MSNQLLTTQTGSAQRQRNWSLRALHVMVLCLMIHITTVFGLNFNVPLASLTNHNTSACSNYTYHFSSAVAKNFGPTSWVDTSGDTINIDSNKVDMSLNPVTPGHVSHVNVHTLIPSRPDLRWFANGTCWWGEGPSHHINNGTTNTTEAYAAAMVNDMESRGFDGMIFSWYGVGDQTDEVAKNVKAYLDSTNNTINTNFTFIIMIVEGYFAGGSSSNNFVNSIHYCQTNYFNDVHYEKEKGHPLLMFFNVYPAYITNATEVNGIKAATDPNIYWVQEGVSQISQSWVDMTYLWTDDYNVGNTNALASNPYNLNAVTNKYATIKANPGKQAFGAMCGHFNGTLTGSIGWSLGKYLPSGDGLCEYYRAKEINMVIPTNMTRMQWATWSDYEEGTQIESGTENNFALTTSMNMTNVLSWTITSGDERTIDHYEVYASTDSANAALLCSVPSGIHQTNISQWGLDPGNYQFYVDAIGLPCIRDHLSTPATQLPSPWLNQDIGNVGVGGSATYTNGTFTVSGSGADIWGSSDSFQFVYQPWNGDGQIVVRVLSISNTASVAKAGLMFRETLDSGSAQGDLFVSPTDGVSMQNRTVANGSTSNVRTLNGISAPCWLSLIRLGNYLYSYESADDVNWTPVGTNICSMGTNIYVGLCVTAKSNVLLNTSTFDHVAVGSSTVVGMPEPMVNASNYTSSLKITFSGYNRSETLSNFPVLVRLGTNVARFSYTQFASASGNDLRFTSAGSAVEIPYEINRWDTNGISTVWVQVPALSGTNDAIFAYWGNPGATNAPHYTTNGAVWLSPALQSLPPYDLVYHLEQNGFPYFDSTLQHPATNELAPGPTNGIIGNCCAFNGSSQFLDAGLVQIAKVFTLSAWVNIAPTATSEQTIWCNKQGGWNTAGFDFYINSYQTSDGKLYFDTADGVGGNVSPRTVANAVTFGQWHLLTGTMDGVDGVVHVYVDGVDQTINTGVDTSFQATNYVRCGSLLAGTTGTTGSLCFNGSLDETRIYSGLESSNWVWASYMTVAANSSFENYSAVNSPVVVLNIQNSGGNVMLAWPAGTLQSASAVTGPYSDVPGATSPYTNNMSATQQFFRVRVQ